MDAGAIIMAILLTFSATYLGIKSYKNKEITDRENTIWELRNQIEQLKSNISTPENISKDVLIRQIIILIQDTVPNLTTGYSTEELFQIVNKHRKYGTLNEWSNITYENIKNIIQNQINKDKDIEYIRSLITKNNITFDYNVDIEFAFYEYLPLGSLNESEVMTIIKTVAKNVHEYHIKEQLQTRLKSLYDSNFKDGFSWKYGYQSECDLLDILKDSIPISQLYEMTDDILLKTLDSALREDHK